MNNPLLDNEFLKKLMSHRHREVYARITLLTKEEYPIEYIEGRVTGGSINVDGTSALRRTCNLTMVLWDQKEINQFYWTFKSKFKLEIGLKNIIEPKYSDIIWFKQGIFILTTCNMNQATNNYTITINGKDKMCLLNGDLAGALPHSTDFGVEEYYDKVTNETTYTKVLLKNIIRNAVQVFGGEAAENIIINDLDEAGLELLEYRGDDNTPMYLFREVETGNVENVTINGEDEVWIIDKNESQSLNAFDEDWFVKTSELFNIDGELSGKNIYLYDEKDGVVNKNKEYQIIKLTYGDLAGYRLTDLTFAGDLKANVGETIVSVLDKIKNMLGEFEYFYNLDGKFVFQKKRQYVSTPWGGQETNKDDFINAAINDSYPKVNLTDAKLTTSFANNPNILNVKNDFAVWGTYKSISGADIPIHMRYAVDTKPTKYCSLDGTLYDTSKYDWRELIYQMALDYNKHWTKDDFATQLAAANPQYPFGKTGYEQYYVDIQGFWRDLYDPNPEATYDEIAAADIEDEKREIYVQDYYYPLSLDELEKKDPDDEDKEPKRLFSLDDLYVIQTIKSNNEDKILFYPFIKSSFCCLKKDNPNITYSCKNETSWKDYKHDANSIEQTIRALNAKHLDSIYILKGEEERKLVVEESYKAFKEGYSLDTPEKCFWIKKTGEKESLNKLNDTCKLVYRGGISETDPYVQYLTGWAIIDNYGTFSNTDPANETKPQEVTDRVVYLAENENGDYNHDGNTGNYWNKMVETDPGQLLFWFDFLETEGSDLYKYSVREVGSRTKAINDSNVKSIYYRDVPNVIFSSDIANEIYERKSGYTYIQLPSGYQSLFSISGRGKSAKERVDELLQEHSYAIEQTNITAVPLYHLEPNTRVSVSDEKSKVDGEYIVTKVTVPLAYNGTMSLSTTKVVSNIM